MKYTFKKLWFILIALLLAGYSQSQQIEDFESLIKTPVLPSPDVASLGKYGQIPVNLNNGIPQINIPLYEMKSNNLDLNISVS